MVCGDRALKAAFFFDLVIRGIDRGHPLVCQLDEVIGHALGDQLVGMVLANEPPIGLLDVIIVVVFMVISTILAIAKTIIVIIDVVFVTMIFSIMRMVQLAISEAPQL